MTTEIKVPVLPESVADATIAKWHKKPGENIKRDETLVDIETDKVVLEVPAPNDGVLDEIICEEGKTVTANEVIGKVTAGAIGETVAEAVAEVNGSITRKETLKEASAKQAALMSQRAQSPASTDMDLSPAVRRLVSEHEVDVSRIQGSGKGGRILKEDVEKHLQQQKAEPAVSKVVEMPAREALTQGERPEQRVPMSRLRQRIAERLLNAQQSMAILTTFNEIDMKAVMDLRKQYRESFEKAHSIRLGFLSFFVKAVVAALKRFPDVNAFIDGNDIVYHGYCDIGVAVSTERGLVVPVLRNADAMSMAEIEAKVAEYARKARDNKLTLEEMTGGTFSITNGGVFGSLLATPIINPPQSAILGMHKIEERPVVVNGEIVIRPMMYIALSYDHRIIDGKESVQFLRTVKELIEDPARLLLDV